MHPNLTKNEREVIKLVHHFKKRVVSLKAEGKFEDNVDTVLASFESLLTKLDSHAELRANITAKRDQIKGIIKDNASCPKCGGNQLLKHTGERKVEEGWMCNVYKCRKCNIEFVWARPNNPWDMRSFLNSFMAKLKENAANEKSTDQLKEQALQMLESMERDTAKLSEALDTIDTEYAEMKKQDESISQLVHNFKNYLMIEKIKMDSWNTNPQDN